MKRTDGPYSDFQRYQKIKRLPEERYLQPVANELLHVSDFRNRLPILKRSLNDILQSRYHPELPRFDDHKV